MNDEKIIALVDDIVFMRSRYSIGSAVALEIVNKIDELVAHVKSNY